MARFAQYAVAATEEALEDAGWKPTSYEQRQATVGLALSRTAMIFMDGVSILMGLGCMSGLGDWQL